MDPLIKRQLRFFASNRAGCLFAAVAARDPTRYGWVHRITAVEAGEIDTAIHEAIADTNVTTLSVIFPDVTTSADLVVLLQSIGRCKLLVLDQTEDFGDSVCLGYRCVVDDLKSYVEGFGDFPFLPVTRRTPFVELAMRVKPRPAYSFVFKEAPPGVIHLADLDMKGIPFETLQHLWDGSFANTRGLLGVAPDIRSAARTTFSVPKSLFSTIR